MKFRLTLALLLFCAAANAQSSLEPFVGGGIFRSSAIDPLYRYAVGPIGFPGSYVAEGLISRSEPRPFYEAGLLWLHPFRKFYPDLSLSAGYYSYTLHRSLRNLNRPDLPDSTISLQVSHLRLWPGISINGTSSKRLRLHCTLGPSIWLPLQGLTKVYIGAAAEAGVRYRMFLLKAGFDLGVSRASRGDLVRSAMPAFKSSTLFAGLTVYCGKWRLRANKPEPN